MKAEERYHCVYGFKGPCADCEESKTNSWSCDKKFLRESKIDAFNAGIALERDRCLNAIKSERSCWLGYFIMPLFERERKIIVHVYDDILIRLSKTQ